jgi:hypothetical protein
MTKYVIRFRWIITIIIFSNLVVISCTKTPPVPENPPPPPVDTTPVTPPVIDTPLSHGQYSEVVYVQTNNYMKSMNAIIAYGHTGTGKLIELPGSPFFTGGSGISNPNHVAGPNESDNEIKISNDGRFLLAANSGSNTIAVFSINADGSLTPTPGSPFPSGGETPVSMDMWKNFVIVLNKSDNPLQPAAQKPNYTVLQLQYDGSLTTVSGGKFELPEGSSPAQVITSKINPYVYGTDYKSNQLTPPQPTLHGFWIPDNGTLVPLPGPSTMIKSDALGLCHNPFRNCLYVAHPSLNKFAIYDINASTGELSVQINQTQTTAPGPTRIRLSSDGLRLFVLTSDVNGVDYFSTNQNSSSIFGALFSVKLKNPGPKYTDNGVVKTTSTCASLGLSSDNKWLFVVSQHTNPDVTIGNYNFLHVVQVQSGGLTENNNPIQLPVSSNLRPRGVAVAKLSQVVTI